MFRHISQASLSGLPMLSFDGANEAQVPSGSAACSTSGQSGSPDSGSDPVADADSEAASDWLTLLSNSIIQV